MAAAGVRAEYCREKAEFCIATGVQPSEYDQLADDERAAFIEVVNELNEK